MIDMSADLEQNTDEKTLKRALKMAQILKNQMEVVADLTEKMKAAAEIQRRIEFEDLPTLMKELGLQTFSLETGEKITINSDVSASITKEKAPAAMAWLIKNNFGGLIKTKVLAEFGKDDIVKAEKLAEQLIKRFGDNVAFTKIVHPAMLKRFVKEQLEKGKKFPLKLFGVHQYDIAKLTLRKKRK